MLPALGCRIDSPEVPPQEQRTAAVRSRTQAGTAQQRSPPALPADKGTVCGVPAQHCEEDKGKVSLELRGHKLISGTLFSTFSLFFPFLLKQSLGTYCKTM